MNEKLVTIARYSDYLEADLESGQLVSCSCGHPYPLLLRGAEPIWLSSGGPLLGISEDIEFEAGHDHLQDGDILVLYTDGVAEAGFPEKDPFGAGTIVDIVQGKQRQGPYVLAERVIAAVQDHVGTTALPDDATVMAATYAAHA